MILLFLFVSFLKEARRLLAAEEASMEKPKKAPKASVVQKVTRAQLEKQREKDQEQMKQRIAQNDRKTKDRTVTEDEYDSLVSRPNLNHQTDLIQANTVDSAIAGLQEIRVADQPAVVSCQKQLSPCRCCDHYLNPIWLSLSLFSFSFFLCFLF